MFKVGDRVRREWPGDIGYDLDQSEGEVVEVNNKEVCPYLVKWGANPWGHNYYYEDELKLVETGLDVMLKIAFGV